MANITVNIMLGWCGISVTINRNRIIADVLTTPEVIDHINDKYSEGLLSTYRDYAKRTAVDRKIMITRIQKIQIIAFKDWVKDRFRLEEEVIFKHGTTQ